jgi:MYXO-CTERM domain-containing protein
MKTRALVLSSLLILSTVAVPGAAHADDGDGDSGALDAGPFCVGDSLCFGKNRDDRCGDPAAGGGCVDSLDPPSCFVGDDASVHLTCQLIYAPSDPDAAVDSGPSDPSGEGNGGEAGLPPPSGTTGISNPDAGAPAAVTPSVDAGAATNGVTGAADDSGCNMVGGSSGDALPAVLAGLALLVPFATRRRRRR